MDEREILTRFKAGTLGREEAARLLTEQAEAPPGPVPVPEQASRTDTVPLPVEDIPAADGKYAVVGLAGRYAMADDPHAFWENLREGRDTSRGAPVTRPGGTALRPGQRGRLLDGIAEFDPDFFGLTPAEAALMDPQERLFLETAWAALEDAGCTGSRLDALTGPDGTPRAVGVFVGVSSADYALLAAGSWGKGRTGMPGSGHGQLPGRLAAPLGLTGPGQAVDTGDCSALTALHLAVASLARGECAAAVAGGVELLLHPSRAGDGAGEGVGAVVLKRLDRALADGDRVHAVVRGTASGFRPGNPAPVAAATAATAAAAAAADGRRRGDGTLAAGDTGPRQDGPPRAAGDAQQVPQRAALDAAGGRRQGDEPRASDGTGRTLTRDVVERWVGQAGAALGIAGITAAVLQVAHGVVTPVQDGEEAVPWRRECDAQGRELPRRATVVVESGGGLVARAVVEEFPPVRRTPRADGDGGHELVLLSAPSPAHLAATAARLADWLEKTADGERGALLADVARELRVGRAALPCRIALLAEDMPQLVAGLRRFTETRTGDAEVRHADLRDGGADPLALGEAAETRDYVAALWRSGRLEQLTRLWLNGVDVDWAALENRPATADVVPPPSALLRRTLWLDTVGERAG
ncbi:beta-ketoacyl synthase N-terminal-like domain-containing protein [Streptomyces sp. S.PB5]|uniref:beta-ketoacyl synthase N-terminal-like domain-containing protein n=1 Tax=Streptomyces sp. S.PB5 TaxID=3020844 RepID=UPI0025B080B0|nr:beta-ketoacyl synthase N-terminal-like domain-containing protein [Streptomyces sp. S.PB5]MDN3027286.1 beta-ketoacyl synthase N-terminal-like domain-containing protein [Streptomyces sp. S.PB5]